MLVNGSYVETCVHEAVDEMAPDEATGAGDEPKTASHGVKDDSSRSTGSVDDGDCCAAARTDAIIGDPS